MSSLSMEWLIYTGNQFVNGPRLSLKSPIPGSETSFTSTANKPNGCSVRKAGASRPPRVSPFQPAPRDRGHMNKHRFICERLKKFGYASERRIRMYGEELHVVSDHIADDAGYCVLMYRKNKNQNVSYDLLHKNPSA